MSRFVFIDDSAESLISEKKATNSPKIDTKKATLPQSDRVVGERFVLVGEGPENMLRGGAITSDQPAGPQPSGESLLQSLGRNALRLGSRAVETTLGLPGDLIAGTEGLIRSVAGLESPSPSEGPRNIAEQGLSALFQKDVRLPQYGVPTSTEIRENLIEPLSSLFFGDASYTQPQSDTEKFVDNVVQDFITLALPGSLMRKGGMLARQAIKSFKVAGLSNLVPFLGEKLGMINDEGTKDAVKLGSALAFQFIPSLVNPGNLAWFQKRLNPQDAKSFANAFNVTSKVHEVADSFFKSGFNHPFTYFLFGKKVPLSLMALRGAGHIEKGMKALNQSPALRRYVKLVFQNSLKNNAPLMLTNMRKADNLLQRLDKSE